MAWEESKHPRDNSGQFTSKGNENSGGGETKKKSKFGSSWKEGEALTPNELEVFNDVDKLYKQGLKNDELRQKAFEQLSKKYDGITEEDVDRMAYAVEMDNDDFDSDNDFENWNEDDEDLMWAKVNDISEEGLATLKDKWEKGVQIDPNAISWNELKDQVEKYGLDDTLQELSLAFDYEDEDNFDSDINLDDEIDSTDTDVEDLKDQLSNIKDQNEIKETIEKSSLSKRQKEQLKNEYGVNFDPNNDSDWVANDPFIQELYGVENKEEFDKKVGPVAEPEYEYADENAVRADRIADSIEDLDLSRDETEKAVEILDGKRGNEFREIIKDNLDLGDSEEEAVRNALTNFNTKNIANRRKQSKPMDYNQAKEYVKKKLGVELDEKTYNLIRGLK